MSHWVLWHWVFWHWVLCPDTHFLVFLSFQKHFCTRAGVFSVPGIPQNYFQNTLEKGFFESKNLKNWANWVSHKHFGSQIAK